MGTAPLDEIRPAVTGRPLSSVLIANRGEIVIRIARTLAARGIRSVAVYTPPDAAAPHVRVVDRAVAIEDYLDGPSLVAAARESGADAVHPGYGFLSEDPFFARAVLDAGLVWVGPPPAVIEAMGDKIRAKETAAAAGVPVVPGVGTRGLDDAEVVKAALEVGLPVLLKPAAGGGGKGMRRVDDAADLPAQVAAARRETAGAFGDDTLLVERWVDRPRHIEVQVFADRHGNVVHLGERECSLQRRHQKIVEECPAPSLTDAARAALAESAVAVARACGYVGAGTVEFIVPAERPGDFFFMEMNTRLQVEHPVTEAVTGIDLVDWQLRVAVGEALPKGQDDITFSGHAVEARVYAEDPGRGFLPAAGTVIALEEPVGAGVRVDAALHIGLEVGTRYDPMLAKVMAWGPDRGEALHRLRRALGETTLLGVTTNIGYLVSLLGHPDVAAGRLDTHLVPRTLDELVAAAHRGDADAATVAAVSVVAALEPTGRVIDPWDVPDGWRLSGRATTELTVWRDGAPVRIRVAGRACEAAVQVGDGPMQAVSAAAPANDPGRPPAAGTTVERQLLVTIDGTTARWRVASSGEAVWVGCGGRAWRFVVGAPARSAGGRARRMAGPLVSPMPGVVAAVHVVEGDQVVAGQALVAVEAMKMEHVVTAPSAGVVSRVLVRPGQTVALDEPLAEMAAAPGADSDGHRCPRGEGSEGSGES